jgi:23S rRNA pseudoU1915 N3-methylase RlmH
MKGDLTHRQENFAQSYARHLCASDAYRASYSYKNMKKATVNRRAIEVLQTPKVAARIKQLKNLVAAVATERFKVDAGELLRHLDILRKSNIKEYVEIVENKINVGFDDEEMQDIYATNLELRWKPFSRLTEEQTMCIESIKETKYGIELKLHGKDWTIEKIAKHTGFYEKDNKQKVAPIEYKNVSKRFPDE